MISAHGFSLGTPGLLAGNLKTAGYQDVQEQVIQAPLRFASAEECVRWHREASGTMQQMLSGLGDDAKEKIWTEVTDEMRQFGSAEGFVSPCELLICSAVN